MSLVVMFVFLYLSLHGCIRIMTDLVTGLGEVWICEHFVNITRHY